MLRRVVGCRICNCTYLGSITVVSEFPFRCIAGSPVQSTKVSNIFLQQPLNELVWRCSRKAVVLTDESHISILRSDAEAATDNFTRCNAMRKDPLFA